MLLILSGDVGGTNTRLQLWQQNMSDPATHKAVSLGCRAPGLLLHKETFSNESFGSFEQIVDRFLQDAKLSSPEMKPTTACLACAGPIVNNSVTLTNRGWVINGDALARSTGIKRVELVNDFVGMGYGLLTLDVANECITLNKGNKQEGGPMGCIGAGTGLGECFLTAHKKQAKSGSSSSVVSQSSSINNNINNDDHDNMTAGQAAYDYTCYPTEGGHTDFAPRNSVEGELLDYLRAKFASEGSAERISNERVVAGSGIPHVYEFLSQRFPDMVNKAVHAEIARAEDLKAACIAKHSNDGGDALCRKTMDIFLTHYGSEVGNCCLKWCPTGGLFITGGLTPKNIARIQNPNDLFLPAVFAKGRVSIAVTQCPIYAVLVEDLGERGAHLVAFRALQDVLRDEGERGLTGRKKGGGGGTLSTLLWAGTALGLVALGASSVLSLARRR
jgi:glucokinase